MLTDVLLLVEAVNHAAGAEEQQGFEERVRHHVEDRGTERADSEREEHVAELGDRRVREDLLDVVLHQADRGRDRKR